MAKKKVSKVGSKELATFEDYQRTFGTPYGRRVLWHMMKMNGFLEKSYVPGDPHGTSFNDGARNVINTILKNLKVDIPAYAKMLENYDPEEEYDVFNQ